MKSPIIIVGMHRSGTSMISRFLEDAGLFQGKKKDDNNESVFFLKINEWIIQQSGGSWDQPLSLQNILDDEELKPLVCQYVKKLINSPYLIEYLGFGNYVKYTSAQNIGIKWGWKDPRNTFTIPLWLDLFPEARIVHISRHGVDVAKSLFVRRQKGMAYLRKYVEHSPWTSWMNPLRPHFLRAMRIGSIEQGFNLWKIYMQKAMELKKELGDHFYQIRYEDFLSNPSENLQKLCGFCELSPHQTVIDDALLRVDISRAYSYRKDSDLLSFEKVVAKDLRDCNY